MKLSRLDEKVIGEKLASPIYAENGVIFMGRGSAFTARAVESLKRLGVNTVYIDDSNDAIQILEMLETSARFRILRALLAVFISAKKTGRLEERDIETIVKDLIKNINPSENAFLINNISRNDETVKLCVHSLDVAVLALIMGMNKHYDDRKLIHLGMAALLHDIGKLFSSGEEHVMAGYNLVKQTNQFSSTVYMSIYEHHEHEDGTGYPSQMVGAKIYELAKVISICNEYVNLINSEEHPLPSEAIEIITAKATSKFDQEVFRDFVSSIYCYPNGLPVKLNNNLPGIVMFQNKNYPTRPVVGVVMDGTPRLFNLMNHLTLFIDKVMI